MDYKHFALPILALVSACHHGEHSVLHEIDTNVSAEVVPYEVTSRSEVLEEGDYYPCDTCHDPSDEVITEKRDLEEDHEDLVLEHGGGQFWCLMCHDTSDRNSLRLFEGSTIDFDTSYKLCGECHFMNFRDFEHGAHGKRVGSWNGDRLLVACTSCHNPHSPTIKARKPKSPPHPPRTIVEERPQ